MGKHGTLIISTSIITGAYVLLDIFVHNDWYDKSKYLTISLQDSANFFFDFIFGIASFSVYEFCIGPLFIILYLNKANKIVVISYILWSITTLYVLSILKMIYFDGRPYYDFEEIKPLFLCDKEFGNPSGHAFCGLMIYSLLLIYLLNCRFDFIPKRKITEEPPGDILSEEYSKLEEFTEEEKVNNEGNNKIPEIIKNDKLTQSISPRTPIIAWTLTIIWIILVGISRIYFGSHSFNQILLGYNYGFFSLIIYYNFIQEKLESLITFLTIKNNHYNLKRNSLLLIIFALFVAFNMLTISVFLIADSAGSISNDWIIQIENKCSKTVNIISYFHYKCFTDSGVINSVFGVIFGIILTRGSYEPKEFKESLKSLSYKTIFYRTIAFLICIVIPVVFLLIPFGNMILLKYFLQRIIALTFIGFNIIAIIPRLYRRFDIDIKGDYLKQETVIF